MWAQRIARNTSELEFMPWFKCVIYCIFTISLILDIFHARRSCPISIFLLLGAAIFFSFLSCHCYWASVCTVKDKRLLLSVGRGCVQQISTHIIVKWIFTLWPGALASLSLSLTMPSDVVSVPPCSPNMSGDEIFTFLLCVFLLFFFSQFRDITRAGSHIVIRTSWYSDCFVEPSVIVLLAVSIVTL